VEDQSTPKIVLTLILGLDPSIFNLRFKPLLRDQFKIGDSALYGKMASEDELPPKPVKSDVNHWRDSSDLIRTPSQLLHRTVVGSPGLSFLIVLGTRLISQPVSRE